MIKNYKILKEIAVGGMADVYLAVHHKTNQPVVIKSFHPEYFRDKELTDAIVTQIEQLKSVDHPNIVKIHDVIQNKKGLYVIEDYIEGMNLRQALFHIGQPDEKKCAKYGLQILQALKAIHDRGMIHGDIKPENILIDNDGNIHLTDFLLIKDGRFNIASVHYMSPEQHAGIELDRRTDLFSFGCVIYEILTGNVLFSDDNAVKSYAEKIDRSFAKNIIFSQSFPQFWKILIFKLIASQPDERYQSADSVIETIHEAYLPRDTEQIKSKTEVIRISKTEHITSEPNIHSSKTTAIRRYKKKSPISLRLIFTLLSIALLPLIILPLSVDRTLEKAEEIYLYGGSYQYFDAILLLLDSIENEPRQTEYYYLLAQIFTDTLQDYTQAMSYLLKVTEIEGVNARNLAERGRLYHLIGNMETAEELLLQAFEMEPDYAPVYNYLGNLYYQAGYTDYAIEFYNKCLALHPKRFTLANIPITDGHFAFMTNAKNIRDLDLSFTELSSDAFFYIKKLKKVEILKLRGIDINDYGFESLQNYRKVKSLILNFSDVTSKQFNELKNWKKLRRLEIGWSGIDSETVEIIGGFESLETLNISATEIGDRFLIEMNPIITLKHLYLNDTKITGEGIRSLTRFPLLETVDLSTIILDSDDLEEIADTLPLKMIVAYPSGFNEAGVEVIAKQTNLQYLFVSGEQLEDADFGLISNLTRLKVLFFNSVNLQSNQVTFLSTLSNLRVADMSFTTLDSAGLSAITNSGKLLSLNIQNTEVDSEGTIYLRHLTDLWKLNLSGTSINDDSLTNLSGLTRLETLLCDNTPLTGSGIKSLYGLPNLIKLSLSGTELFGSGFSVLSGMRNLLDLNLSGTLAGDPSMNYLSDMDRLILLNVASTRVSWAGLITFRSEHPECEVVY